MATNISENTELHPGKVDTETEEVLARYTAQAGKPATGNPFAEKLAAFKAKVDPWEEMRVFIAG